MKIGKLTLLLILFLLGIQGYAEQVSFTMEAPKIVELGEQFRLSFSVNAKGQNLKLPELSDFDVLMGPSTSTSSSYTIINGVSSQSINYSYLFVLRAKKVGKFTISPASITVNGNQLSSNGLTIEVVKGSAKPSGGGNEEPASRVGNVPKSDLFVKVLADRRSLYKGDHLIATIKIYSKVNLNGFEDISLPNFEGFWAQDVEIPQQIALQRETLNGEIYNVGTLKKTILFPQQTGNITIGPVKIDCIVQQRVRRSSSFFDDFFDSFANVKATIVSDPVNISVNALPSPPANFSGAVGHFDLNSSITTTSVKENDPVTIKLNVSGNGNIKLINPPKLQLPPDFEAYDPKTTSNFNASADGVNGSISFEYLFLPRNAGDYTIPPVQFVYFDPSAGRYVTKSTQDFKIRVARGALGGNNVSVTSKEDVRQLGDDIRFLKQGMIKLYPKGYIFFGSFGFYALYLIGIIGLALLYFFNQKRIHDNANIAQVKNKKASKVALKRLKEAHLHLKSGASEKFYESITRAFWGYLSDKLTIPIAELTRESASQAMEKRKVSNDVIPRFIQILDTCEYDRFAPGGGSAKMQELYDEATDVMSQMEKQIKG